MDTVIIGEMAVLVAGNLVIRYQTRVAAGDPLAYENTVVHDIWRPALAAALIGAGLLGLSAAGMGTVAGVFGGLIVLGYLTMQAGVWGPAVQQFVSQTSSTDLRFSPGSVIGANQ